MKWQKVRDLGLGLFKKRTRSRTLWISGSTGVVALFAYLLLLTGVSETHTGDITCGSVCESYVNITSTYWRICFEDFNFITTDSNITTELYVPTYGYAWRLFNPEKDCIERGLNKFKIVGYKDYWQTIKWTFDMKVNIDPIWNAVEPKVEQVQDCKNISYDVIEYIYGECSEERYNYSDCLKYTLNKSSKAKMCTEYGVYNYVYSCETGKYIVEKTRKVCTDIESYKITTNNEYICDYNDWGTCTNNNGLIVCDSKYDGNNDGVCQSGESCITINASTMSTTRDTFREMKADIECVKQ